MKFWIVLLLVIAPLWSTGGFVGSTHRCSPTSDNGSVGVELCLHPKIQETQYIAPLQATPVHDPTPEEEIEILVSEVPHLLAVLSVSFIENGDVVILEVVYITNEIEEFGYRAEILDVFRVIGNYILETELDVDEVLLVPSVTQDVHIEFVVTETSILLDFVRQEINRSEFIRDLEVSFVKDLKPDESEEL